MLQVLNTVVAGSSGSSANTLRTSMAFPDLEAEDIESLDSPGSSASGPPPAGATSRSPVEPLTDPLMRPRKPPPERVLDDGNLLKLSGEIGTRFHKESTA